MSLTPNVPKLTDALLTLDERVATLTFNRDDLRNALTGSALIDDICAVAEWVNRCDDVSVLVMTGDANPANQSDLLREGANDLVLKPIEERLLVTKVLFQLRLARMDESRALV